VVTCLLRSAWLVRGRALGHATNLESVKNVPVNYAFRFSGPVTASPPAVSGMASDPTSSASPVPSPGIKTHSSPAAFPTTLWLPFVPFPLSPSHTCLHRPLVPLRPRPSSTYSPARPLGPQQNRYDATSEKNVAAQRLALIRSTPRQHCLADRLTRAPTPGNDADEAPGVPAGRRRLGHATASDARLSPPLRASSTDPSHLLLSSTAVDQGRVSTLTGCVTAASPLRRPVADLHRGLVWSREWLGLGADCAATRPMEKMTHAQPVLGSRMAQRLAGSRLKLADVAGMLGSSEAPAKTGRSFSLARMEIDGAQRGTPVQLRARWGPMEKMPRRGDIQVRPRTAVRRAGSCAVRNPPSDFKLS
jgi:hypothetical protein